MLDKERFREALVRVIGEESAASGIGTLAERSLHRTLKYYYEPDGGCHEIEYLGSVADIKNGEGIVEIQTGSFSRMVEKLRRFLPTARVTVVYPLVTRKRIKWLDKGTGELTESGRDVRGKVLADCGRELYAIREFIGHPSLTVRIVSVSVVDYRYLDGYDSTRKRRATKLNTVPEELTEELTLSSREDYLSLLPSGLGDEFSAKEFSAASRSRSRYAYYTLRLLVDLGLLERHSEGRAYKYKRIKQ